MGEEDRRTGNYPLKVPCSVLHKIDIIGYYGNDCVGCEGSVTKGTSVQG